MTRRKRRGPAGPPRCDTCKAPIAFYGSPFTGSPRPFNPRPVDPHTVQGAYPVMSRRAYRLDELVEVIQVQRECSAEEASDEIYDMPWHTLHACPEPDQESDD